MVRSEVLLPDAQGPLIEWPKPAHTFPAFDRVPARLLREVATLGWSGPKLCSQIRKPRWKSDSARLDTFPGPDREVPGC